jgi:hypothetical protein
MCAALSIIPGGQANRVLEQVFVDYWAKAGFYSWSGCLCRVAAMVVALPLVRPYSCAAAEQSSLKRYLITDHGAVADGQTLNTKTIQAVIDTNNP